MIQGRRLYMSSLRFIASVKLGPMRIFKMVCIALLTAACGVDGNGMNPLNDREQFKRKLPPSIERIPPGGADASQPVTGEAPAEIVNAALDQAASLSGRPASDHKVVVSEAVTWPDGSLGCARPGQNYTHAPVNGYRIVVESQDERFVFHSGRHPLSLVLCHRGAADDGKSLSRVPNTPEQQ